LPGALEGVGEHVRVQVSHSRKIGGEIAEELPQTERNVFLPGRLSPSELFEQYDPAA
jgi:hypothetical protein